MQIEKLQNIVSITVGHTLQKSVSSHTGTDFYLLRTSDIPSDFMFVEMSDKKAISIDVPQQNAFVDHGDILITARSSQGASINCSVFDVMTDRGVLATSSLFIMRVTNNKIVLPEYIAIYLNSTDGQQQLKRIATQGTIQSISIKQLKELEIPIPSMEAQGDICELAQNILEQKELLNKKIDLQNEVVKNIISSIIK